MGCFPVFAYFAEIVDFCAIQSSFSGPFRKSAQKSDFRKKCKVQSSFSGLFRKSAQKSNVKFSLCLVGRFEKAHKHLIFATKKCKAGETGHTAFDDRENSSVLFFLQRTVVFACTCGALSCAWFGHAYISNDVAYNYAYRCVSVTCRTSRRREKQF